MQRAGNPYSRLSFVWKYVVHLFKGKPVRRLHSPLFFSLCRSLYHTNKPVPHADKIGERRNELLRDKKVLNYFDPGSNCIQKRSVSKIARTSHFPAHAELKGRLSQHTAARRCIEIGSSLGLGAAWIRAGMPGGGRLITLEGVPELADLATITSKFTDLPFDVLTGDFENTLPGALRELKRVDLVVFDGNHRLEPTLKYLEWVLPYCHPDTVLVFDDIHWSAEMEQCWEQVKLHPDIPQTLDLFFSGLAFPFRKAAEEHLIVIP